VKWIPIWNTNDHAFSFVVSVVSRTAITLTNLARLTTGTGHNAFTVYKGFWADHSAYGSATNRGLHDMHLSAGFYNPGGVQRTTCERRAMTAKISAWDGCQSPQRRS
jgi:hypothetical protein